MRLVDFGPETGYAEEAFGSRSLQVSPLTPPLGGAVPVQAACFRLGPGGRIVRHRATWPQLFTVVEGAGWVSGADGEAQAIAAGQAAWWARGEEHETWTDTGLTAIVIEGDGVEPR